jgi:hypothetical protein
MQEIKRRFDAAKRLYDRTESPVDSICETAAACLQKLTDLSPIEYGGCSGKAYSIYLSGEQKSRPFLPNLFISDPAAFVRAWGELMRTSQPKEHKYALPAQEVDRVLYTAIMGFAVCYDLWKPKSRKTPGTFFEVLLGSLVSVVMEEARRTKFISLPPPSRLKREDSPVRAKDLFEDVPIVQSTGAEEPVVEQDELESGKVSTDIVFNLPSGRGIVIPAKITTRERIVQPFAHQRILDSAFGVGRYVSVLACVSETQRDDDDHSVNEICVPGTIALFQEYLASLEGIYYLDTPKRYSVLGSTGLISVGTLGGLLTGGLDKLVKRLQTYQSAR